MLREETKEFGPGVTRSPENADGNHERMIIHSFACTYKYACDLPDRHNGEVLPGTTPTKGRLLVATPPLADPNFDRSVVYMLEHHESGALGVVLNVPTTEPIGTPLDRWVDLLPHPAAIFRGGPVETDALLAVAHAPGIGSGGAVTADSDRHDADDVAALTPVVGDLASVDLGTDPALLAGVAHRVRIFRGYAGWGPGQLEGEIDGGAWVVVDAQLDDVFSESPQDLWRGVLKRQPGRLAWLAHAPDDLEYN